MFTAAQISAGGASLLLGGAIAWLVLSEFPVVNPGRPTTSGGPLMVLEASPITIDEFEKFRVNDENPFIPYNLRQSESLQKKNERNPTKAKPVPPPVTGEVVTPEVKALPRLPPPGQGGPLPTGLLISKDGPQAMLTFPGDSSATLMKPGDTVKGWTLIEVSDGNVVRVKDVATGTVQALVVPEDLAVPAPAPDDKTGAGPRPGTGAKPNASNGAKPNGGGNGAKAGNGGKAQNGEGQGNGEGKRKRKNGGGENPQQPPPANNDPAAQPAPPPKPADKML